jgi:hypothetical protein
MSAFEISLRRTSLIAFMNPFDIQMHVSRYCAIDTKHVYILVKFGSKAQYSNTDIHAILFSKGGEGDTTIGWAITKD